MRAYFWISLFTANYFIEYNVILFANKEFKYIYIYTCSVVTITTVYGMNDRETGVRVPVESRIFTSPCRPDRFLGPPNPLSNGYRVFFLRGGAKRKEREADHSPPTSAEVKKTQI
jgi:hypothetical protein